MQYPIPANHHCDRIPLFESSLNRKNMYGIDHENMFRFEIEHYSNCQKSAKGHMISYKSSVTKNIINTFLDNV